MNSPQELSAASAFTPTACHANTHEPGVVAEVWVGVGKVTGEWLYWDYELCKQARRTYSIRERASV